MLNKFKQFIYKKLVTKPLINPNVILGNNNSYPYHCIISTSTKGVVILYGNNYIGENVEISTNLLLSIGYNTSIQHRCTILGLVEIGSNCLFATNVYVSSGNHNYKVIPELLIKDQDENIKNNSLEESIHKKVTIDDDCWIGTNVVIMSGVHIGKGCVVGANSVVTKSIPPYTIVAGSPAKVINTRLDYNPPKELNFNHVKSVPYFYGGFKLDNYINEIQFNDGVYAGSTFRVALNYNLGDSLELEIFSAVEFTILIQFQNQTFKLSNKVYETIKFVIREKKPYDSTILDFKILCDQNLILEERVVKIRTICIK